MFIQQHNTIDCSDKEFIDSVSQQIKVPSDLQDLCKDLKVLGKAEPEPEKKEPEKKEIKRPPSAARIKKPEAPTPAPAPAPASKKIVKEEEEEPFVPPPPPVEEKPAKK